MAPQIIEYNAENLKLQPTEVGIEATAGAARRVNAAFNEAAGLKEQTGHIFARGLETAGNAAVTYLDHQQISQGSAAFAGLTAKATQDWNDRNKNSDPNNPSTGKDWLQNVLEPQLQQFQSGFLTDKGQAWAEANVEKLRNHFTQKTTADMSRKAGEAVVINHAQTLNSWSNAVYNDPSMLDTALGINDQHTKDLVDSSPNLKGDPDNLKGQLTQKNKEMIIKSAALGYIDKTGEMPPWLDDPKYSGYVNATELRQFQRAAHQAKTLDESATRSARVQQDYENKKDFEKKSNELWSLTLPQDNTTTPQLPSDYWNQVRALSRHPGAERGALDDLKRQGDAIINGMDKKEPLARISAANTHDLFARMKLPDDDPRKITKPAEIDDVYGNGEISKADRNFLQKELLDRTTADGKALSQDRNEFFKRFANTIDPGLSVGLHTALGQQQMYAAETDAKRQEAVLKAKGQDPHSLYDPDSPNYLGRDISKYAKSMKEANDYDAALRRGEAPGAAAPVAPAPPRPEPQIGEVRDGWKFNGGNWRDKSSWSRAGTPTVPASR